MKMDETAKTVVDGISIVTMLGTLGSILPPVSRFVHDHLDRIRIYETDTVQNCQAKSKATPGADFKDDD